jgi:23S rRNA (cytidine2498-2'-O)-methyltransferase
VSFLFAVCQAGAEQALRDEVRREHPELRPAYGRPGFVTWKSDRELPPDLVLRTVFARAYGLSVTKARAEAVPQRIAELKEQIGGAPRVHLFLRDRRPPEEEEERDVEAELAPLLRALGMPSAAGPPVPGEPVVDAIGVAEDEWWIGWHLHGGTHSPHPGGRAPLIVPPEAPSRAYAKLAEVLDWSGAPLSAGDVAVELGSAPGGAAWLLLERGLEVVGVDPAAMAPSVLARPSFTHLARSAARIRRSDLPAAVHWLLLDMNVSAKEALGEVERFVAMSGGELCGAILTLKLNRWALAAEVPSWLEQIGRMGFGSVRAAQLFRHRREIVALGLTAAGLRRVSKGG